MFHILKDYGSIDYVNRYLRFLKEMIKAKTSGDFRMIFLVVRDLKRYGKDQYLKDLFDLREHETSIKLMEEVVNAYYLNNGRDIDPLQNVLRGRHSESLLHFIDLLKTTPKDRVYGQSGLMESLRNVARMSLQLNDAQFSMMKKFLVTALSFNEQVLRDLVYVFDSPREICEEIWVPIESDTKKKIKELVEELRLHFKVSFCVTRWRIEENTY
ncbi:hypothetical protein CRE_22240 [Caenorhabditis remanei]|uniref:Uncharacterized protein n=2 Tax=Caenorhabditis remanei TaxID=31234 RepID=E3NS93_CAERE|nr:hypothetical protein CRE_22240 [Caenorhabditis remanei]